jgi:hypothetical protein
VIRGHQDGGLCGNRMAALPGLSPVEQLIRDEDGDQQHQHACHGVGRQRVGRPPASLPGVREFIDDKR